MNQKTYDEIDKLIENAGLKYKFVAMQMGISSQRLYVIRTNPDTMNVKQMEQLAELTGTNFDTIYKIQKNFRNKVDKNATV